MPQNHINTEIRSEEVQEILTHIPNWMIRWGNTLILAFVFMLLAISWFVKYPDTITSQVMITTINPPQKLYANSNGKFDAILVEDTDTIRQGTNLAIIENSALYKDVLLLKSIVDTIQVDKSDFSFPIHVLPPLILGDINPSFSQFENNYSDYDINKRLNPYENQSIANRFSLSQAKVRLQILIEQKKLAEREFELKKKGLKREKLLFEKGVSAELKFEQKELEFFQSEKALKSLESSISQIRELISNSNKNLKGTSIEKQQKDSRLLKNAIQSFYQLKKEINDWEKRYVLKSDINGQVSFLSIWDKNQIVKTGDLIFTIIPIRERSYIAKIEAPAANSGKIKINQKVQIQLANFPSDEYGELNGAISFISLAPNQQGNYLIDVSIDKELTTSYNKKIPFRQEMKGTAKIITEDLRLIHRFFYQLKNIIN
ncbi:HlyD family efflux transporter periplasmic adaptor subunit [Pseudotenacibaculum sp. MALMAid0570]|uniref:HlyD family secretion protein n=1 Tax=Pseudotenacibaculum sp. MALMAid0570 TaxID=3143938 RepID=UPI0032DEC5A4